MTDTNALVLTGALLCTASLLLGWLTGRHEREVDDEIVEAHRWHQHVQQALLVARRTPNPDDEDTVAR